MTLFLTDEELVELTGKKRKSSQLAQLRLMGIAFYVNASGHPKVCRSTIDKSIRAEPVEEKWVPKPLRELIDQGIWDGRNETYRAEMHDQARALDQAKKKK